MAEGSEMKARLARLQAELAQDLGVITRLAHDIAAEPLRREADRGTPDAATLALLAVRLHRYYTALENAFERIERAFDALPTGPDWHRSLLDGAALELPGIRPPIVTATAVTELREVLKFRHFFRHAYAVELDGAKLAVVAAHVVVAAPEVEASLTAFIAVLGALASHLG